MTNERFEQENRLTEFDDVSSFEELFDSRPRRTKPTQFPTGKAGRYSKDRRYIPIPKKSDANKKKVRSGTGKGAKHKKGNTTP